YTLTFVLVIPRQPLPPLFPYTTLFRSQGRQAVRGNRVCRAGRTGVGLWNVFEQAAQPLLQHRTYRAGIQPRHPRRQRIDALQPRSEEHTSELQSRENLVCRLLLEKKKN